MPLVRVGDPQSGKLMFLPNVGPSRQRKNERRGSHHPDGRRYQACPAPQCGAYACLENKPQQPGDHVWWNCVRCGFIDCDTCPGGEHVKGN